MPPSRHARPTLLTPRRAATPALALCPFKSWPPQALSSPPRFCLQRIRWAGALRPRRLPSRPRVQWSPPSLPFQSRPPHHALPRQAHRLSFFDHPPQRPQSRSPRTPRTLTNNQWEAVSANTATHTRRATGATAAVGGITDVVAAFQVLEARLSWYRRQSRWACLTQERARHQCWGWSRCELRP